MANEASYVPLGRDNTGAAVQLNPFDSSKIFAAYDKANAPVKTPLLDSYGNTLKTGTGAVDPKDRWYVEEAKNKEIDYQVKLRQRLQAERRDVNSQEQQQLEKNKMETIDRLSILQKQQADRLKRLEKGKANPYSLPSNWQEKEEAFWNIPANERIGIAGPDYEALPEKTVYDIFKDIGKSTVSKDITVTKADGSSYSEKVDTFDPKKAEENFNKNVVPMLANPYSEEGRILTAIQVNKLQEESNKFGVDWSALTPDQQSELVMEASKADYFAAQQAQVVEQRASSRKAKQDKEGDGSGSSSSSTNQNFQPAVGWAYKIVKDGKIIPTKGGTTGEPAVVKVLEIPIKGRLGGKNDQFAQLNKPIRLNHNGKYITGTIESIKKYGDTNDKWQNDFWVTIADDEGTATEVLMDPENKRAIETEFKVDVNKLIDEQYPGWRDQEVELTDPTKSPEWNTYKPEKKAAMQKAYDKKIKASTTPVEAPPKEKGALQKGIDMVKGFFTTTPAKTTRDPDEEFKRK